MKTMLHGSVCATLSATKIWNTDVVFLALFFFSTVWISIILSLLVITPQLLIHCKRLKRGYPSRHDILASASNIWSLEGTNKTLLKPSSLLQIVCLCSTTRQPWVHHWKRGSAQEPRRGKPKGKKDPSRRKSIWRIPADEPWQSFRRFSKRGGKGARGEPGNRRRCALPKTTTAGQW